MPWKEKSVIERAQVLWDEGGIRICNSNDQIRRTRTRSVNKLRRKDQSSLMSSIMRTSCSEPREQYSETIAVRFESLSQPSEVGETEREERLKFRRHFIVIEG